MKRSSILAAIVLSLFALPFLGMGLVFAFVSISRGGPQGWIGAIVGLFFACIGLLLIFAGFVGVRRGKQQDAVREANPGKPWLWRNDWAEGRASGNDPRANITAWVFAAIWDAISAFLVFSVLPKLLKDGDAKALLVAIFPLAGIFITTFTVRATLRIWRYGRTSFWCDSVPFSLGGRVKGSIRLKLPTSTPHGIDLRLSCKRRIVTGSGKNRTVRELVFWQEEKNVPAGSVLRGPEEALVPVEFAVPTDAYETDGQNPNDRVIWELHAEADVAGVDFSDNYELPVFRTQAFAAAASQAAEAFGGSTASFAAQPQAETPAPAPAETRIVHGEDAQGTTFYFPPLRNRGQALGVVVFTTIWTAVVYFLWIDQRAPWLFRIVFSLFEILAAYMLLNVVFGSATLRVRQGALHIRKAILGIGSWREIPLDEVESISLLSQGQTNTSGRVLYGISVKKSAGREIKLVANSLSTIEARWVVATLERAMGRKQDTRVEFDSMYGAPPQTRPGI